MSSHLIYILYDFNVANRFCFVLSIQYRSILACIQTKVVHVRVNFVSEKSKLVQQTTVSFFTVPS